MKQVKKLNCSKTPTSQQHRKKILQFWTGGADSTYLLLQNLLSGHELHLAYVNVLNEHDKTLRKNAQADIWIDDIKKFREYYNCELPQFYFCNKIYVCDGLYETSVAPIPIIVGMYALLIGSEFDEIQICSQYEHDFYRELAELHSKYLDNFPPITNPINNIDKKTIYLTLKQYDDLLGTDFINHISVCDNKFEECCEVLECLSCITQQKVFQELKWVK